MYCIATKLTSFKQICQKYVYFLFIFQYFENESHLDENEVCPSNSNKETDETE